jgi:hypothetical protein
VVHEQLMSTKRRAGNPALAVIALAAIGLK